jgi:hypothetical protein
MGRDFQGSGESPSKEGAKALSPRYIQKIVVMHACMRSVANEQFRETRLVIIRCGRFAIGLNPFWHVARGAHRASRAEAGCNPELQRRGLKNASCSSLNLRRFRAVESG